MQPSDNHPIANPSAPSAETLLEELRDTVNQRDLDERSQQTDCLFNQLLVHARSNDVFLQKIIEVAIPLGVRADPALYDYLVNLHHLSDRSPEADELCGMVWSGCLIKLSQEEGIQLLTSFPLKRGSHLFDLLGSLPTVLKRVHVPSADAILWFRRIREAIGEDLNTAGYWLGIDAWANAWPGNAAEALLKIPEAKTEEQDLFFGARILANLRALDPELPSVAEMTKFDGSWATSSDPKTRAIYHHSWSDTVMLHGITETDVLQFLRLFERVEGEALAACFNFVRCLIVSERIPINSIDPVLQWLRCHINPDLDALQKHWICVAVRSVWACTNDTWDAINKNQLRDLIIEIQPIAPEHEGTWREVDRILALSLKSDGEGSMDFIQTLYNRNPTCLKQLLDRSNRSLSFFIELSAYPRLQIMMASLFSSNMQRRRFGLILINSGLPLNFTEKVLQNIPEQHLALGLLQIRFDQLIPQQTCALLLQLLPRIEKASRQLQELLREELTFQARNLPGLCLEHFKRDESPSPLLKSAIEEADLYFEQLRESANSPITSMHVPGLNQARRAVSHRQSRLVNEKSQKESVFLSIAKSVHLIYGGDGFADYRQNYLSEPIPFQTFSASVEMPRLDMMDYDGKKLRMHYTLMQIRFIEEQIQKDPDAREP